MAAVTPEQKAAEKNLQQENKTLRNEIKQIQNRVRSIQSDLTKSNGMKDRLEALCRELQKQNKFIKAESSAKIQEANEKGKELAVEVQNNMGFMKNINENLASITAESQKVRKENEELAKKVCVLQDYYEQREKVNERDEINKILQDALQEAKTGMVSAKTQLAEFNLKNAQEKEKLIKEMQQLADALEKSHEQLKEGKETEKGLRALIQNYDEKFTGLQKALQDTNGAYTDFKKEMEKVTLRTKELERDTFKWQQRWEESNAALTLMRISHEKIKTELGKSHESLGTMTNLCRALQTERKDLLKKIEDADSAGDGPKPTDPTSDKGAPAIEPSVKPTGQEATPSVVAPVVLPPTPAAPSGPAAPPSGPAAPPSGPAAPPSGPAAPPSGPAVPPSDPPAPPSDPAAPPSDPAPPASVTSDPAASVAPSLAPASPKSSPAAPKSGPGTQKSSPVSPKASPTSPKASPASPKASPASPKAAPASPKATPTPPKASPTSPKAGSAAPKSGPTTPAKSSNKPKSPKKK